MLEIDKIYNDDCMTVMKNIENNSIDLLITDPPYKVTARGCYGNTGGMLKKKICMEGNVFQYNNIKPCVYAGEFYRVLKDGSHCYVMTNNVNLIEMLNSFTDVGFHFIKSLIWDKHKKIMGLYYMGQFEYILFFRKGKGIPINDKSSSDIITITPNKSKDENGNNLHDTEKPVELMEYLIKNSSKENDIVLDPFCGIGSTCIACKNTKRHYIGIEIDEKYADICKKRLN